MVLVPENAGDNTITRSINSSNLDGQINNSPYALSRDSLPKDIGTM